MSDYKSAYSEAAHYYTETTIEESIYEEAQYRKSKERERKHDNQWKKQMVNINDICDKFAPGDDGYKVGIKYIFEGSRYQVVADMASGYLRIYDKNLKCYVKLDGTPSKHDKYTHFKIFPRKEL